MKTSVGCREKHGFTLVEMLVVLAIISILAGLSAVGIQKMREQGNINVARSEIALLKSNIESFRTAMGDYPPSSLSGIKVVGNGVNDGNESLFGYLLTKKASGPFATDLGEDRWKNNDNDELTASQVKIVAREINWTRGNNKLLEYCDFWFEPYVYIHHRDYGKKFRYVTSDGTYFDVEARKNSTTGTWYAPTTFQLWSLGPDGINQNGEGDDLVSWN